MELLTHQELKDMLDRNEDFALINVLPEEKFRHEHIPGSLNIPVTERGFNARVEEAAGGKEGKVVVYCADFDCHASVAAAHKLEHAGFTQVYDYAGGMADWREAGYPVEHD